MEDQPPPNPNTPSFQDSVTETIMSCEELRLPFKQEGVVVTAEMIASGRDDLDFILASLGGMHQQLQERWTSAQEQELNTDLFQHCQGRVQTVAQLVLEKSQQLQQRIEQLMAMQQVLQEMAGRCRGDEGPDCAILEDLAASPEGVA